MDMAKMMNRHLDAVEMECLRQHDKWGEQNYPNGTGPVPSPLAFLGATWKPDLQCGTTIANKARDFCGRRAEAGDMTWRDILLEEVFEALAENDPDELAKELVQVAAVCVSWLGSIERAAKGAAA